MKNIGDNFTSEDLVDGILVISGSPLYFSIIDDIGNLVIVPVNYTPEQDISAIDFSNCEIENTWTILPKVIQYGRDSQPGIQAADFIVALSMLKVKNRFSANPIRRPAEKISDTVPVMYDFSASGKLQIDKGNHKTLLIPSQNMTRQYLEVSANGICIFEIEVFKNDELFFEGVSFPSSTVRCTFPTLLIGKERNQRILYKWRVRAKHNTENAPWTEWSPFFYFKINIPPTAPAGLQVTNH